MSVYLRAKFEVFYSFSPYLKTNTSEALPDYG